MHPAPWKCSPTSLPTVSTMPQFFPIYLLFYSYFTFRVAPITIFGYAPWTLKVFDSESVLQHYPTNSEHNHLMFSDFSFILLAFYIWKSTFFLIWKYSLNPQNVPQCYHQQWATYHCKQQVLSSSLSQAASPLQAHNILWAKALTVGNHQFSWEKGKFFVSPTEKIHEIWGNKRVSS